MTAAASVEGPASGCDIRGFWMTTRILRDGSAIRVRPMLESDEPGVVRPLRRLSEIVLDLGRDLATATGRAERNGR